MPTAGCASFLSKVTLPLFAIQFFSSFIYSISLLLGKMHFACEALMIINHWPLSLQFMLVGLRRFRYKYLLFTHTVTTSTEQKIKMCLLDTIKTCVYFDSALTKK